MKITLNEKSALLKWKQLSFYSKLIFFFSFSSKDRIPEENDCGCWPNCEQIDNHMGQRMRGNDEYSNVPIFNLPISQIHPLRKGSPAPHYVQGNSSPIEARLEQNGYMPMSPGDFQRG